MSGCDHCNHRGWGIRNGFVRRCEVCEQLEDDDAAREVAMPALMRFALPERPTPHVPESGEMRCPWCDHLPTNEDHDTFWHLTEMNVMRRARVGPDREGEGLRCFLGDDSMDTDTEADPRLQCPKCWRTF